jgi:mono/diheme cytochrome c family protein
MRTPLLLLFAIGIITVVVSSCQSESEMLYNRYYTSGSLLYRTHCENCHGVNGEGLSALIPSLHDSVYLKKNLNKLPCFIKNGLGDAIVVDGKIYNSKMPAQGNLSAIEVAEILTYVTNSFGNKMGLIDAPKVNADWSNCN